MTAALVVLTVVLIALGVRDVVRDRAVHTQMIDREQAWAAERRDLLNRLEAKTAGELAVLQRIDKPPLRAVGEREEPKVQVGI